MIVTEYFATMEDGLVLNKTYSNAGYYIEREGMMFSEAIDPADLNRVYTETDVPLEEDGEFTDAEFREMVEEAL